MKYKFSTWESVCKSTMNRDISSKRLLRILAQRSQSLLWSSSACLRFDVLNSYSLSQAQKWRVLPWCLTRILGQSLLTVMSKKRSYSKKIMLRRTQRPTHWNSCVSMHRPFILPWLCPLNSAYRTRINNIDHVKHRLVEELHRSTVRTGRQWRLRTCHVIVSSITLPYWTVLQITTIGLSLFNIDQLVLLAVNTDYNDDYYFVINWKVYDRLWHK